MSESGHALSRDTSDTRSVPVYQERCRFCEHANHANYPHSDDVPCLEVVGPCRCPQCQGVGVYAELCMCHGEDDR